MRMKAKATAEKPTIERYSAVQQILANWTGKEMPELRAASVAVGQLVGTDVLTFMMAYETLDQSARARGYYCRFDSEDVDACIDSSLRSGQFSQVASNDN
jgi:hypothetical protein